jgi:hypothetical protein
MLNTAYSLKFAYLKMETVQALSKHDIITTNGSEQCLGVIKIYDNQKELFTFQAM